MFEIFFGILIVVLIIVLFFVLSKFFSLQKDFEELRFAKQSQSVKYGQLSEQWIPFSEKFPFNPQNFRFIGKPIDGLCFEDDKIVFVEIKTNTSSLSEIQKRIKRLVEEKKIEWLEFKAK